MRASGTRAGEGADVERVATPVERLAHRIGLGDRDAAFAVVLQSRPVEQPAVWASLTTGKIRDALWRTLDPAGRRWHRVHPDRLVIQQVDSTVGALNSAFADVTAPPNFRVLVDEDTMALVANHLLLDGRS